MDSVRGDDETVADLHLVERVSCFTAARPTAVRWLWRDIVVDLHLYLFRGGIFGAHSRTPSDH